MKLDSYTMKARVLPFVILVFPVAFLTIVAAIIGIADLQKIPTYLFLSASFVVGIIVRNSGKVMEKKLWYEWGGAPTTRYLRYNNDEYNKVNKGRCHNYFKTKCPEIIFPTKEQEDANPSETDLVYEACISILRVISQDKKKYKLIHSENTDYGFMRNSFGVKKVGCIISALCAVMSIIIFYDNQVLLYKNYNLMVTVSVSLVIFFYWLLFVSKKNVKVAAENYAQRLLEICLSV